MLADATKKKITQQTTHRLVLQGHNQLLCRVKAWRWFLCQRTDNSWNSHSLYDTVLRGLGRGGCHCFLIYGTAKNTRQKICQLTTKTHIFCSYSIGSLVYHTRRHTKDFHGTDTNVCIKHERADPDVLPSHLNLQCFPTYVFVKED